nr:MAG TPA: hypothetical protein [Caudoviricetes sp.]
MRVTIYTPTSQLMKGLPVTKDTLDSLIGTPVYDSIGNRIGAVEDEKEMRG